MVKYLIEAGADVSAKDYNGMTPLHYISIVSKPQYPIIVLLLINGADINARDKEGMTLIHHICEHQYSDWPNLEFLIKMGADINLKDNQGLTPLAMSRKSRNQELIKILEKYGAHE